MPHLLKWLLFGGFSFRGLKNLKEGDSWFHSKEHSKTEFRKKNSVKKFGESETFYRSKCSLATGVTPVAWSIFRPLSQTHISKSEFKNGHISRFCSVFQVIQVISSARFLSAGRSWPQLQFRNEGTPPDFELFFLEKRQWKSFSTNVLIQGEMNPLQKHKIMSVGYQVKQNLESRSWTHF